MPAMLIGSITGLACYFSLGWYTASLLSAAISMTITVSVSWLAPVSFDFKTLEEGE